MKLELTWDDAAKASSGRLLRGRPGARLSSLSIDSRKISPGEAFLPLKGERFDAHSFLDARLAGLCGGWIVRRGAALPEQLPPQVLEVEDTLRALADVAGAHRSRFDIPVAGITGTNGKTTTKEMLRAVLARKGEVCATEGNHNNEVGLPWTVLGLGEGTRYAIFEMGASHPGDISYLCRAARPTIGIITNIGAAHLEFFGSLERVFRTKSELIESLPKDAPAVLNADDPYLTRLLPGLGRRAFTFGEGEHAQVRALAAPPGSIRLRLPGPAEISVSLPGCGRIHRLDAAAAAAAAHALGFSPEDIRAGLSGFRPAPLRMAPRAHSSGSWFLIDAYNANPDSMRAGIETFLETAPEGKRFLVLGDMRELGPESGQMHHALGQWLASLPLAGVFLTGTETARTEEALRENNAPFEVLHAADAQALRPALRARLGPGVCVYFKASRAMRLEALAEAL
ncbi:MAG: UDP-N-acetylmuramoyl-tripeptide--D-alanyl-D-alanine ligase [Elusimicrobiota bacterium]|jgi:UDP-N-acetylmuramoyl-tripeptide--D-alanyl-D-alanine ligase